jgi:hypothetical protein
MKQILAAAIFFALAACQQGNDDNIVIDDTNSANAQIETLPPDETVTNDADDAGSEQPSPPGTPEAGLIPSAFRGRWGMTVADCDPNRDDAKGLVTIGERSLVFYESRATLSKVTQNAPENFTGTFAFTGEGENWTNSQNLKLTGSSNTLLRKQSDIAEPFTYKRCA